jgi:hypothetical protein
LLLKRLSTIARSRANHPQYGLPGKTVPEISGDDKKGDRQ